MPDKAVFYLHGQRSGFRLMNTVDEIESHSQLLGPVFEDAGSGRLWIVVGYSGENDPVFDHLAKVERFDNGLFWVGYQDAEPASHVRERLLEPCQDAYYVGGFYADGFFVSLTQKLEIFPPSFVRHPFKHLEGLLEELAPYQIGTEEEQRDVTAGARDAIRQAAAEYNKAAPARAEELVMAGAYEEVMAMVSEPAVEADPGIQEIVAWAFIMQGNALLNQARTKEGEEANQLFEEAYEKYGRAVEIKPDMHEALYNWGIALLDQAKTKEGEEADRLFGEAYEKYGRALEIKPDKHEALNNWGTALSDQAMTKEGEEVSGHLVQAIQKWKQAEALRPASATLVIARRYAWLRDGRNCSRWLRSARDNGTLPAKSYLDVDPWFEPIKATRWFKRFLSELAN